MKKVALLACAALVLCLGGPASAQGPFPDVPTDHWAYDAVNQLAAIGAFTGYPDRTFGGKRAMTRYEFSVAMQRIRQDLQRRIDARASVGTGAPAPPLAPADRKVAETSPEKQTKPSGSEKGT